MAYRSFLSWFQEQPKAEPDTEIRAGSSSTTTEKRDFGLQSLEAQRLFVFGTPDLAGVTVTNDTALQVCPFFGAMRYVSEGIAMLDRSLKKRKGENHYPEYEHPLAELIFGRPHPYYTWFDLLSAWVANAMLGNGYIRIHWDLFTGRPAFFEHLPQRFVWPQYDSSGFLWYRVSGELNGRQVTILLPHTDVLHLKGFGLDALLGKQIASLHKHMFGTGIASDEYSASVMGKGAFPSIAIKTDDELDSKEVAIMEENAMRRIGGARQAGRPFVLDKGQDVQYLQWSPLDVALEAVKHLTTEQVSQITKVPRDFLALDTRGTYGAASVRDKQFYTHCLQPWVEKIQEEFNSKIFTESEIRRRAVWFEFDPSMYNTMTPKEQTEMFSIAIKSSQLTPNEVRKQKGLPPMNGGDSLFGDINSLPLEQLVEVALAKYLSSVGEKAAADDESGESANNQNDTENEPDKSQIGQ